MPGKGRFGATGQATHIDIEHLKTGLIVMLVALTVLTIDALHGLFHLLHILWCTGIQRVLHHRLLGTAAAAKGSLQGGISSEACIDLPSAMGSGPQTVQSIVECATR